MGRLNDAKIYSIAQKLIAGWHQAGKVTFGKRDTSWNNAHRKTAPKVWVNAPNSSRLCEEAGLRNPNAQTHFKWVRLPFYYKQDNSKSKILHLVSEIRHVFSPRIAVDYFQRLLFVNAQYRISEALLLGIQNIFGWAPTSDRAGCRTTGAGAYALREQASKHTVV